VAVGASTGGPPALEQVLMALAADLPAAVVIAQHMPEGFTRMFADRLDRIVGLRVKEAEDGEELVPGLVLLAPGGKNFTVQQGMGGRVYARIEAPTPADRYVPSADRLLSSAAAAYGSQLVSVVLTGMGDDGGHPCRAGGQGLPRPRSPRPTPREAGAVQRAAAEIRTLIAARSLP
jgi:two-component system chemotaxis response regulator CheB